MPIQGQRRIYATRSLIALALALLSLLRCEPSFAEARLGIAGGGGTRRPVTTDEPMKVELGLGGVWKLGHPTPLRLEIPGIWATMIDSLEISTVDGDGVPITYMQPLAWAPDTPTSGQPSTTATPPAATPPAATPPPATPPAASPPAATPPAARPAPPPPPPPRIVWTTVTIGRTDRPLKVRALDRRGTQLQVTELSSAELGQPLPTTQTWMVAVASSMGVEATSYTLTETGLPNFTTTVLTSASQVPTSWRAYSGCDLLIIASGKSVTKERESDSNSSPSQTDPPAPIVAELTALQWNACEQFVVHGGTCILSVGEIARQLPADSPLRRLVPGEIVDFIGNVDTSPLEAATATNFQLAPITATRLKDVRGRVELSLLDSASKRMPWWVRHSIGKGVLHYIGSDLDHPVLLQWKDRRLVWDKLLAGFWLREQSNEKGSGPAGGENGSGYLGYDDLTGQLRATLDYFPRTSVFSFAGITAILAVLLLVIGPLDYVVSVRWLRRPSLSWLLSGFVVAGVSAGLIWLESASRPKQLLLNSAQVVDFLPSQKLFVVDGWTHVYSSRARTIDVSLTSKVESSEPRLDWQGLPGKGLGGMESNLLTDQNMPRYTIHLAVTGDPDLTSDVAMTEVGIPASGTKCLYTTFSGKFEPTGTSQLSELKGIDQIQGVLVNPLPYDIQKPMLVYHNWSYALPSRLRAGEEVTITYDMVPKDLMRRLNRRQVQNTNEVLTRWDPEDRQSLDRLLEIMMFYKASGGFDYIKLKHRFQPRIDISPTLSLDHAVLYGQLVEPLGQVHITSVPEDQVKHESSSTWCRVLLPVVRPEE